MLGSFVGLITRLKVMNQPISEQQQSLTLTLPLQWIISRAINNFEGYIEEDNKAVVVEILSKDPQETFLHIEERRDINGKLILWEIWRKIDWLQSLERETKNKVLSAKRVAEWEKKKRNIKKLQRGIMHITGMDEMDAERMA